MASSPGGCETVSDPRPVVVDDHTPERSTSPFTSQWGHSVARLSDGATSLTWAPDGEHILFSSGGLLGVYVVDSAGLELRSFPETAPQFGDWERPGAFAPSLSPDGSQVAYSVFVPQDSSVIETAAFDGSDVRRLTPIESDQDPYNHHNVYPIWSPDGQQIAFVSNRGVANSVYGFRLFIVNVDGTDVQMVAPSVSVECLETWQGARWSPDGNWLAFAGSEPRVEGRERYGLYTVRLDGSEPTRVGDLNAGYCSPAFWSPDSSRLAYMGPNDVLYGTSFPFYFIVEIDELAMTQLVATSWFAPAMPPSPAWSPNGDWLTFAGFQRSSSGSLSYTVYVVRPDGSDLRNVTSGHKLTVFGSVVWSPDGEEIWFASGNGGRWHAVRPNGSGLREVISGGVTNVVQSAWSPEASLLALLSLDDRGQFWLHLAARDGSEKRVLVRGTAEQLVAEHSDWGDVSEDIAACAETYSGNPGLVRDCQTLLKFRDTLAGEALLNWNASVPIQDWQGIILDGSPPRVRRLIFGLSERNTLTGVLPPELGSLSALEALYLKNQRLTGEIPSELGNLSKLRELDLSENKLNGSIPPSLGNLANLVGLTLSRNQLNGSIPSSLGNLANLERLTLSGNRLSGRIPPELGKLELLSYLSLNFNNLTGTIPAELGESINLTVLDLSYNQLSGTIPPEFGSLKRLINLHIQANYLGGCVPAALFESLSYYEFGGLEFCD